MTTRVSSCLLVFLMTHGAAGAGADPVTQVHAWRLVQKYKGGWSTPPTKVPSSYTNDAPLMGNGDVGVVMGGNIDAMTFYIGKNEFWTLAAAAAQLRAVGSISVAVSGMTGASYSAEQDLARAEVRGRFSAGGSSIETTSWVAATENLFVVALKNASGGAKTVTVTLNAGNDNPYPSASGSSGAAAYRDSRADDTDTVGGHATLKVRLATRLLGTAGSVSGGQISFSLPSGATVTLMTSVLSNRDNAAWQSAAVSAVTSRTPADVDALKAGHRAWWEAFWAKSFLEIENKTIEKLWYGSLYLMGSASRAGEYTPGLWGPWIDKSKGWRGDFTLNNNFESPFYGPVMANHPELAASYDKPVIDWIPNGEAHAAGNGFKGVYYRVHLGPMPNGSLDTKQHNQKFCATLAASPMVNLYYMTYDRDYAIKIYPYLKQVAAFWEDYLYWDGGRYVVLNDSQPEGDPYPQTNGVASLGYIRYLLRALIDISTELGTDAARRATWVDIRDTLSAYPTFQRLNPNNNQTQTVFRVTEVGTEWNGTNTHSIRHIYYGHAVGMEGDATLRQIGLNTVDQLRRWQSTNGTPSFYPAAARLGYNPATILSELQNRIGTSSYPNLHIHSGAGGIENLHIVPATIGEMLVQSVEQVIRPFSNWPGSDNAKFGDLRAYGAFLVSGERRGGQVLYVRVVSEKGRALTLRNPWGTQALELYRNGVSAGTVTGGKIGLATAPGEVLHFAPAGTSYQEILDRMDSVPGGITPTPTVAPTATPTPTLTPSPTPTDGTVEVTPGAAGVTASTHDGNVPANTVDGSLSTRWSSNGDGQWIRFDLGASRPLAQVAIAFYKGNERQSRFDLQLSNDGASWTAVLSGALSAGATTAEETFDLAGQAGRFVRYVGHGNTSAASSTWNSVTEVSVFAVP
jgi:hypothetical protein